MNKWENLRKKLSENKNWPLKYMFKVIVPNKNGNVNRVTALLPLDGEMTYKNTENLKHVSVTCVADMESADAIIQVLEKLSMIEGAMIL